MTRSSDLDQKGLRTISRISAQNSRPVHLYKKKEAASAERSCTEKSRAK